MGHLNIERTCSEDNCDRGIKARGLCRNHYEVWRRRNRDLVRPTANRWDNADGTRMECFKEGCSKPVETQGLCQHHYQNFHYMTNRGADKTRRNRKLTDYDGVKLTLLCTFEGCEREEFNPGFCAGHYYQKLQGKKLTPLFERADCPVPGCEGTYSVKLGKQGVCRAHSHTMSRFSITRDELIRLFSPGVCSAEDCGRSGRLHIDHDHACCPSGKFAGRKVSCGNCIRGLLCSNCNAALGLLGDNVSRMRGLLKYLENAKAPSE